MSRGRGHRGNLLEIGTELNIVPFLDMMTVLVVFLLTTITGFLSFTMLNASIPQIVPDSGKVTAADKAQLLLMVRVTRAGYDVDPNVMGAKSIPRSKLAKKDGRYDFPALASVMTELKEKFPTETRVLIIAEPKVIYDDIIQTMDAVREKESGSANLFPDVTLSIL